MGVGSSSSVVMFTLFTLLISLIDFTLFTPLQGLLLRAAMQKHKMVVTVSVCVYPPVHICLHMP